MKSSQWVKMNLPNDETYITIALNMIESMAIKIGFNENDINKIKIGSEEALVNVIEHAFNPDQTARYELICSRIPLGIKILIKEKGMPFDPEQIPRFSPEKLNLDEISLQGLGFFLMKKYMDEIAFFNLGREGKELQLIKYLSNRKIDEYEENEEGANKNIDTVFNESEGSISQLGKDEAIWVSRFIYQLYDYYYLSGHLYYPERVSQLQKNGKLFPYVIKDGNKIWGYSAISFVRGDHKIGQIDPPVIHPTIKKDEWTKKLIDQLKKRALELDLEGLYCRVWEDDKDLLYALLEEAGAVPVALQERFGSIYNSEEKKEISAASVMVFIPIENKSQTVYLPDEHKEVIEKIYKMLKINRNVENLDRKKISFSNNFSKIETIIRDDFKSATMIVCRYGKDIFEQLDDTIKDLKSRKFDTIYLRLSVKDPLTAYLTPEFEERGFFFAGILPMTDVGDVLILQSLKKGKVKQKNLNFENENLALLFRYVADSMKIDPIQRLIYKGESDTLEFKSTLRWNLRDEKKDFRMEYSVMKTISAFLNSFGGTLLIGVEDDGNILGIEKDGFENHDKFLLHFSNMVKKYMGIGFFEFIRYNLFSRGEKTVLKVDCFKCSQPVFIKYQDKEDFFIRSGPSSIKLSLSEAIKYILSHFSQDSTMAHS